MDLEGGFSDFSRLPWPELSPRVMKLGSVVLPFEFSGLFRFQFCQNIDLN